MTRRLVGVFPDIHYTHRSVKSVEHHKRQAHVTDNGPQHFSVECVAIVLYVVRFNFERHRDPHCHVTDDQEG